MAAPRRAGKVAGGRTAPASATGRALEVDPAFHRAILKIALELRKPSAQSYDALVERTVEKMRLDPVAFRHYLGEHGGRGMSLLLAAARRFGS
jgi:hypothetical protein